MPDITASVVKELRDATNVSMMECKRALVQTEGDIEKATKLLREMGMAVAAKKSSRTANQGLIASVTVEDGKCSSLVEVNCETDFVARNEIFQAFVKEVAEKAGECECDLAEEMKDVVIAKIAEIGENIILKRNTRICLEGEGRVQSYIHLGGKVGVLVELSATKSESTASDILAELAKDITLHIAAANPGYLVSDDIPEDIIAAEREIYAKQVEGKPAEILEKIVDGKINKYFKETCLVNQMFVKDQDKSITQLLEEKGKELDDTLTIKRFVRYQIGG